MKRTKANLWLAAVLILGVLMGLTAWPVIAQDEHDESEPVHLDVPYVPTNQKAVDAMLKLAKVTGDDYVMDLGCGDGRIVVTAAKTYKARGYGIDIDPQRIKESNANAEAAGVTKLVKFAVADIFKSDYREATVVTLFLLDSVNLQLRPRLFAQLKPGVRVVSNTFHMADWKADQQIEHAEAYNRRLHLWIIPAHLGGSWSGKVKIGDKEQDVALTLEQEFQVVSGTLKVGDAPAVKISDVSVNGKEFKFSATVRQGDKDVKVACEAKVEGDELKGTLKMGEAGGPLAAKRQPADVTGKWQLDVAGKDDLKGVLHVDRKDDAWSVKLVRPNREDLEIPAFYAWGSSVRVDFREGGSEVVLRGTLGGDAGGGAVAGFGAEEDAKWTATRVK